MTDDLDRLFRTDEDKDVFSGDGSVWNLFVQLLLPLILLLTFISVIDIERYKVRAEVMGEENEHMKKGIAEVRETYDPDGVYFRGKRSLIEAQRQKLLYELSNIRRDQEKWFRLGRVESVADIRITGTDIDDKEFELLCERVKSRVDNGARQRYLEAIYEEVLKRGKLTDRTRLPVKHRSAEEELVGEKEMLTAQVAKISRANAIFIQNRIVEFVDSIESEVVRLQSEALEQIFDALLEQPETADQETRELIRMLIRSESEKEQLELSNRIYQHVTATVRDDVREFGFLDKTWRQIASIE